MKKATESSPRYVRVNDGIATHNSAMHAELHQRLYDLVSEPDKQKLHITEKQLKDWRALIDQELDLNRAQRSSEMTPQLQKLDDERSGLLTQLFARARRKAVAVGSLLQRHSKRVSRGQERTCGRVADGFGQIAHRDGCAGAKRDHRCAENQQ